jgi:hypothetical protein
MVNKFDESYTFIKNFNIYTFDSTEKIIEIGFP